MSAQRKLRRASERDDHRRPRWARGVRLPIAMCTSAHGWLVSPDHEGPELDAWLARATELRRQYRVVEFHSWDPELHAGVIHHAIADQMRVTAPGGVA